MLPMLVVAVALSCRSSAVRRCRGHAGRGLRFGAGQRSSLVVAFDRSHRRDLGTLPRVRLMLPERNQRLCPPSAARRGRPAGEYRVLR